MVTHQLVLGWQGQGFDDASCEVCLVTFLNERFTVCASDCLKLGGNPPRALSGYPPIGFGVTRQGVDDASCEVCLAPFLNERFTVCASDCLKLGGNPPRALSGYLPIGFGVTRTGA